MKIHPVGAELFHADGQTDERMDRHDKANSRFSQFCERAWKRNPQAGSRSIITNIYTSEQISNTHKSRHETINTGDTSHQIIMQPRSAHITYLEHELYITLSGAISADAWIALQAWPRYKHRGTN